MTTGLMPIIRALRLWIAEWHDPLDPISEERARILDEAVLILDRLTKLREQVQKHQQGVIVDV